MQQTFSFRKTQRHNPSHLRRGALVRLAILTILLGLFTKTPTQAERHPAATVIDTTVVVAPGAESATYGPIFGTLQDSHGPFHGDLELTGGVYVYEPNDSFWDLGSDTTILHTQRPPEVHRVHWVAGDAGYDGPVGAVQDPGFGQWSPWVLDATPGHEIQIVPGQTTADAYVLDFNPNIFQTMRVYLGDPAGNGGSTTTTSDFHIIIDDIGFEFGRYKEVPVTFYEVHEGIDLAVALQVRWHQGLQEWQIRPVTAASPNSNFHSLGLDNNRIRLQRWTQGQHAGVRLWVNDTRSHNIEGPQHLALAAEEHVLLMDGHTHPMTDLQLLFEDPTVRTSGTWDALTTPGPEDTFDDGFGAWSVLGVQGAVLNKPQTLPGPGKHLSVDLDLINALQSSYLETGSSTPLPPELDADGHGVRFWVDPSSMVLPQGSGPSVFVGCPGYVTPCNAMRVRLDQTASGLELVALAAHGTFNVAQIAAPIANEPQQVELRMRNAAFPGSNGGWLELWINGALEGRVEGLFNYDQTVGLMRLGATAVPAGVSGEVAIDSFETWRFD